MAERDGFDHFIHMEIHDQPRAIRETVNEWLDDPIGLLDQAGITTEFAIGLRRIQIVACGSSYNAALLGKYAIEGLARIPVDVDISSEFRYRNPIIENSHTLFVSITQSGETADTLAAQREAKKRGARTLTICNCNGSTSTREADSVIYTKCGPEIGFASTKTFTAQVAAIYLLTLAIGIKRGRLFSGEAESFKHQLGRLPELVFKAIEKEPQIENISMSLVDSCSFMCLGRGINLPIALEGAQKLKELSYVHAEGYPAGEMKHGPMALIEPGMPVVVMAPVDELFEKTLSVVDEVKTRGARVVAVTDDASLLRDKTEYAIEVPSANPLLSPIINVIPLQLLAYHCAVIKGCDVDRPRNLAKSVMVE